MKKFNSVLEFEEYLNSIKNHDDFIRYYRLGLKDNEIAKEINLSNARIKQIRLSLELPSQTDVKRIYNKDKFLILYKEGKNDSEMSRILGVNHITIKNWREESNLQSNFKYEKTFDTKRFMELYELGLNYEQIAIELNMSSRAIADYGKSLNLIPNTYNKIMPTYEEKQIILGTLMGDGHLKKLKETHHASGDFAHSLAQENYCKWKQEKLNRFTGWSTYKENYDKRTEKVYKSYYVRFKSSEFLDSIYNMLYNNKVKYINPELLYQIDALGLAVWFMDDGYKYGTGYCICTNCFSDRDLSIIQQYFLDKFNIHTTIHLNNVLYIKTESSKKFTELVEPYIHKDCEYKLQRRYKTPLNGETPNVDNAVLNLQEIEENA